MFSNKWEEADNTGRLHHRLFGDLKVNHVICNNAKQKQQKGKKHVLMTEENLRPAHKRSRKKSKNKYAHLGGVAKYDIHEKQKAGLGKCKLETKNMQTTEILISDIEMSEPSKKVTPKLARPPLEVSSQKAKRKKLSKDERRKMLTARFGSGHNEPSEVPVKKKKVKKMKTLLNEGHYCEVMNGVSLGKRARPDSDDEQSTECPHKKCKTNSEGGEDRRCLTKMKKKRMSDETHDAAHDERSQKVMKQRKELGKRIKKKSVEREEITSRPLKVKKRDKKLQTQDEGLCKLEEPKKKKKLIIERTEDSDFNNFKSKRKAQKQEKTNHKAKIKHKIPNNDIKSRKMKDIAAEEAVKQMKTSQNYTDITTDIGPKPDDGNQSESLPSKATKTLREKLVDQLQSARFRFINEQLYTCTGDEALELMTQDQSAFEVYHSGFQAQVNKWPLNPVTLMINYIKDRPLKEVVADFGCGEAQISDAVQHKVYSFDLVALNDRVTACDMAHVPLPDSSVHVAVFCLSLMGTNITDFLSEASRVLKLSGTLLVAEVISRFDKVGNFVRKLKKMGFELKDKKLDNKMFVWFEFTKVRPCPTKSAQPHIELSPCQYKRR